MISTNNDIRRIKPLLSYKICINNSIKYHSFFVKGYTSCQVLDVEYLSTNHYNNTEGRDTMKRRTICVLKKARPIKALRLHKCLIRYEHIPDETLIQVTKKIARVQSLSLPYYVLSQDLMKKYICILKNMKGLKRLDYITPIRTDFPDGYLRKFDEILKKFIHTIKRNKINVLNISHSTSDDRIGNSFLQFKSFPSSLNKLTFEWKHFSTSTENNIPEISTSLSHMKNLETLNLAFRNQTALLVSGLSSIPNFSKLISLNIELLNQTGEDKPLPFNKMVGLSNLKNLKLKFDFWPTGLEGFFRSLKDCPLEALSIDIIIDHDFRLNGLKDLISRMRNLEALTLKIYKLDIFEAKNEFRHLFDKISRLKLLKNLKLSFMSFGSSQKHDMFLNFGIAIKKLFTKPIKMQDFSLKTNQTNTNEAFPELITILSCSSSTLRKLKIDIGDYRPKESDFRKIIGLIKDLKNIEDLKLRSLKLTLNQFVCELVNCIFSLRQLQVFELGEIRSLLNKQPIVSLVEKLLSKRGLKRFDCLISFDCHESVARRNRNFAQIDLKKIVQKNPDIQSYPTSNVLFMRYDDDTEWKWANCKYEM